VDEREFQISFWGEKITEERKKKRKKIQKRKSENNARLILFSSPFLCRDPAVLRSLAKTTLDFLFDNASASSEATRSLASDLAAHPCIPILVQYSENAPPRAPCSTHIPEVVEALSKIIRAGEALPGDDHVRLEQQIDEEIRLSLGTTEHQAVLKWLDHVRVYSLM
jgi:hypothetical protein